MNSEVQQTKTAQYGEPRLTNVFMSAIATGTSFRYAVQKIKTNFLRPYKSSKGFVVIRFGTGRKLSLNIIICCPFQSEFY